MPEHDESAEDQVRRLRAEPSEPEEPTIAVRDLIGGIKEARCGPDEQPLLTALMR